MDAASLQEEQVLYSAHLDEEAKKPAQVPPEDSTNRLAKKGRQEARRLRGSHGSPGMRVKVAADIGSLRQHLYIPKVDPYYYQVNWPQAVLQKWSTEKFNWEKSFSLTISQDTATKDQDFGCTEPKSNKGDT